MRFLKKASINDLLQQSNRGDQFRTETDIMSHYKEFELYLSHTTLTGTCGKEWYTIKAADLDEKIEKLAEDLQKALKKNKAVISAIHVPESLFKTSGDKEFSSNYLSLCEAIWDSDSYQGLEFCIKLADEINYKRCDDGKGEKNPIILIVHAGCIKGCSPAENSCKLTANGSGEKTCLIEAFAEKIKKIAIKTNVKIAIENITPYYDESNTNAAAEAGKNCGWKSGEELQCLCRFLKEINDKIASKEKAEKSSDDKEQKNISFGLCVDFCHIFASYVLKNTDSDTENEALCNAMDRYFSVFHKTEPPADIYLFHVSHYGENGEHGALFQYKTDAELVKKIRQLCHQYAPQAPITLEMMEGDDREKACKHFDDMVYRFSAMHTMGEFAKLLAVEENSELQEFFDDLFWIYSSDGKDSFSLSRAAWHVKAYILKHSHHEPGEDTPFGFTADGAAEDTALFRLKAYIYYTRFCNLGTFLAENYYKSFPFSEEDKADDFRLAMNYFMLNDKMGQCVYTGVAYKFNIDFLPRKESFYRFNDGIKDSAVQKAAVRNDGEAFSQIAEMILDQINGSSLRLYSVGKNFGQCLFKYYNPEYTDWSLRIYKDVPINYVECEARKYSIPAFLQKQAALKLAGKDVKFALDVSLFRKGRDGKETSSLNGFFSKIVKKEISAETVGSISDGEIVLTELPEEYEKYTISLAESMLLKKAYLDPRTSFRGAKQADFRFTFSINEKKAEEDRASQDEVLLRRETMPIIKQMKEIESSNQVEKIIKSLSADISEKKEPQKDLSMLTPYGCGGSDCNVLYSAVEKYIEIKKEEPSDGQ